jgi:DNA-binding transcriptional ArsR family regulator
MKSKTYNSFFMNFSTKSKFDILMALREGPLSVTDIARKVGDEQSAVSHNLLKMEGCRVLNVRKDGKQRIYSLNEETVVPLLNIVEKHVKRCCMGRCMK